MSPLRVLKLRRSPDEARDSVQPGRMTPRRAAGMAWFVLSWFAVIAVGIVLVGAIALVTVPKVLGWQGVVVLSGSMEPALKTGGIAFIEPSTAGEVEVGDIITFRRKDFANNMVTHRVIAIDATAEGPRFVTQGDANSEPDGVPVTASELVGEVRFDLPYLGNVVESLQDQTNYYIFIGIPAFLLILNELWTVGAEYRKSRQRRLGTSASSEGLSS